MIDNLTVIIPNYNNGQYLDKCISSIMEQTCLPKQIIVFDDCSTDNSREILKELETQIDILKCIYSEQNVGVSMARHKAIMAAETIYITMLDADDFYITKEKLYHEMKTIESAKEDKQKYICAFSQVVCVNEEGKTVENMVLKRLGNHTRFNTITRIYRMNVPRDFCFSKEAYLQAGGYQKECNLFEDWDLDLRLLQCSEFVFSNSFGTAYRQKAGGLSDAGLEMQFNAKKEIFRKNASFLNYSFMERITFYLLLYISIITKKMKALRIKRM